MKKNKIISLILAAAVIFAVAAIAASCEAGKKPNPGVIVDLPTGESTTATTTQPAQTTAEQTTSKTEPAQTTAEQTTATEATQATVPTTPTTPTEPTVPASTTAEATTAPTTATTTEATTTTPVTDPNVFEYDVDDAVVGKIHVKIEKVSPLSPAIGASAPSWKNVSKTNIHQTCDLVVQARIVSMQEVCITILGNKTYGTVLTLEIERSHYIKEPVKSSRITVYCELSSRYTTTDAAAISIGSSYYFFLEGVEGNIKNTIGFENICEYFISLPPNEDYLVPVQAEIINDNMITLLKNNDRSNTLDVKPGDNLGFVLDELLN